MCGGGHGPGGGNLSGRLSVASVAGHIGQPSLRDGAQESGQQGWVKGRGAARWRECYGLSLPYQMQRSELSFHPSFKEGTQVERGPTEGEARGHHDRLGPVWPTLFLLLWGDGGEEEEEEEVGRERAKT